MKTVSRLSNQSVVRKFEQRNLITGALVSDEQGNVYLNTDEDRVVVIHAVPGSSMKVGVAYDTEDVQYEIQDGPLQVILSVGVAPTDDVPPGTQAYSYGKGDLVAALEAAIKSTGNPRSYLKDIVADLHKTSN